MDTSHIEDQVMTDENNREVARRLIDEVWNAGNMDVLEELVTPDFVHHDPSMQEFGSGIEGFKRFVAMQRSAFPDLHISLEDQIASEEGVANRWIGRGTHTGAFMGIPPTNRQVVASGMSMHRVVEGKIAETWNNFDALGMLRQLGAL